MAVFPAWAILAACDPITPQDRAYFSRRNEERSQRESMLRSANDNISPEQLFKLVRDKKAPDGEGTTEAWVIRQINAMGGQVMFPQWTATRRGSNKQEITFNFIHIDDKNDMSRCAYVWEVDVLEMSASEPQFTERDEGTSAERNRIQSQERRLRAHEKELE